jgi:hypothetical protein
VTKAALRRREMPPAMLSSQIADVFSVRVP